MTIAELSLFELERPASLQALCARVGELRADERPFVLLAGGTDFMVEQEMRAAIERDAQRPHVLDVARLPELRQLTLDGSILRIGAAVTYWDLRQDPVVVERAPLIARMSADVGALQIQARGTLGGNLATASPAADGVAALAAYDATIVVASTRGERRIPFDALQTGYKQGTRTADEVIVAVELPLPAVDARWVWRKVGTRRAQAISKVALAGVVELTSGQVTRCGFGMASVLPVTAILRRTRELLLSTPLSRVSDALIAKAVLSDIAPINDVRSSAHYREHVAVALVREFVRGLSAEAS